MGKLAILMMTALTGCATEDLLLGTLDQAVEHEETYSARCWQVARPAGAWNCGVIGGEVGGPSVMVLPGPVLAAIFVDPASGQATSAQLECEPSAPGAFDCGEVEHLDVIFGFELDETAINRRVTVRRITPLIYP